MDSILNFKIGHPFKENSGSFSELCELKVIFNLLIVKSNTFQGVNRSNLQLSRYPYNL